MATLGIDGLVSSMDTTSIINSLMQLEARSQTLLKTKQTVRNGYLTDLRALNTAVSGITTAALSAGSPSSLSLFSATSSSASVTAKAGIDASPGNISFRVDATAAAQVTVTKAMTAWQDSPPVLTVVGADGTKTEITAASTSLTDVADAINASEAGVTAGVVSAGTDASGTALYRLQITADESGAAGAFTIYRGSAANIGKGGAKAAVNLATETGAATVTAARDAKITLWAGTAAQQSITSATNTFTGVLPGVDITVTKAETEPVTLTIAQDNTAASKVASDFLTKLIGVFTTIADKSKVTSTTGTSGVTVSGGNFTGDSTVRQLKDSLLAAVTDPIDGKSLSAIGIEITKTGTITFDAVKFGEALKNDSAGTQNMFSAMAARVEHATTLASNREDGYVTSKVTGQESAVKELGEEIAAWDLRLAKRREILQRQYTAMETALGSLQSQSTWISSQLSSLTSSKS